MSYRPNDGPRVTRCVSHGHLKINVFVTHRDNGETTYKMNNDDDAPGEYVVPNATFDKSYSPAR